MRTITGAEARALREAATPGPLLNGVGDVLRDKQRRCRTCGAEWTELHDEACAAEEQRALYERENAVLELSARNLAHTIEALEAERDEARAALAEAQAEILALRSAHPAPSPIMDAVRTVPGLAHIEGSDAELLRRVLTTTRGWEPGQARWSHVRMLAGHGSGVGHALCDVLGLDPDEECPPDGEFCERCGFMLPEGGEE